MRSAATARVAAISIELIMERATTDVLEISYEHTVVVTADGAQLLTA